MKCIKQPQYGFQFFHIRVGNYTQGYYKYTANANLLNQCHLQWKLYKIPLTGNATFVRSVLGNMTLTEVNYVEIHADTWDYGYTLWVDGVQFEPCTPTVDIPEISESETFRSQIYPNPVADQAYLTFNSDENEPVTLNIYDLAGRMLTAWKIQAVKGDNFIQVNTTGWEPGIYFYILTGKSSNETRKFILSRL